MKKNVIKPFADDKIEIHAAKVGGKQNLKIVSIEVDDYEYIYLIKKPSRSIIQAIADYERKGNSSKVDDLLINCVLEGDKEAFEHDGSIYIALIGQIGNLITGVKIDIKKN